MSTTIDVFAPERYRDRPPHEDFARLRAVAPVYRNPDPQVPEGHWAITRHADVSYVLRHPQLFSSATRGAQPMEFDEVAEAMQRLMLINQDAPQHARVRGLVSRGFTPRVMERLRERIAGECVRIVETALRTGPGNFVQLCAAELPLVVMAELMGAPRESWPSLFAWSQGIAGEADPELGGAENARRSVVEMSGFADALAEERRGCPRDDIVSRLVDDAGDELTADEFHAFFVLLAVAGNETTRYALTGAVQALADHPEQWARLKADPRLASTAADEVIRWVSPTKVVRRTATEDVPLGGQVIEAGSKVIAHLTSANHDESVLADPGVFDVGRDPNPHLGFGAGPHFCLGRHLALLEIELMVSTLIERVRRIEIIGPAHRLRSYQFNGLTDLPVRLWPA